MSSPMTIPSASTSMASSIPTTHSNPSTSRSITVSTAKKISKKAKKTKSPPEAQPKTKKKKTSDSRGLSAAPHLPTILESSNLANRPTIELLSIPSEGEIRDLPSPSQPPRQSPTHQDATDATLPSIPSAQPINSHRETTRSRELESLRSWPDPHHRDRRSPRSTSRHRSPLPYREHYSRHYRYRSRSRSPHDWDRYSDYRYYRSYRDYSPCSSRDRYSYYDARDPRHSIQHPQREETRPPVPPRSTSLLPLPPPQTETFLPILPRQPSHTSAEGYDSESSSASTPAPSMPSPDELIGTKDHASPSEEMGSFTEQILHMATALGVDAQQHQEQIQDPFFDAVFS